MAINVWENREFDANSQLRSVDRQQEIDYLLSTGGNFIELFNPQESMDGNAVKVTKLDCGIIIDYGYAIKAGTFVHANQNLAISKITDKLIEIIKDRDFLAEVYNCSIVMGELFWLKMQLHDLGIEGFIPSNQLKQRLEKMKNLRGEYDVQEDDDLQIACISKKL